MTVNDTDKFLVNRSGSSYHLEAQNLMAELQDDDLMLVNRSGKSYKATGAEIKESLKPPATVIKPQIIAPADGAGGTVTPETDNIRVWDPLSKELVVEGTKDLALLEPGDAVRQNADVNAGLKYVSLSLESELYSFYDYSQTAHTSVEYAVLNWKDQAFNTSTLNDTKKNGNVGLYVNTAGQYAVFTYSVPNIGDTIEMVYGGAANASSPFTFDFLGDIVEGGTSVTHTNVDKLSQPKFSIVFTTTRKTGRIRVTLGAGSNNAFIHYVEGNDNILPEGTVASISGTTITLSESIGDWSANTGNWAVGPVKTLSDTAPDPSGVPFLGSDFASSDGSLVAGSADWQVTTLADTGYSSIVSEVEKHPDMTDPRPKWTSGALEGETEYRARTKYYAASGEESPWSDDVTFKTAIFKTNSTLRPGNLYVTSTQNGDGDAIPSMTTLPDNADGTKYIDLCACADNTAALLLDTKNNLWVIDSAKTPYDSPDKASVPSRGKVIKIAGGYQPSYKGNALALTDQAELFRGWNLSAGAGGEWDEVVLPGIETSNITSLFSQSYGDAGGIFVEVESGSERQWYTVPSNSKALGAPVKVGAVNAKQIIRIRPISNSGLVWINEDDTLGGDSLNDNGKSNTFVKLINPGFSSTTTYGITTAGDLIGVVNNANVVPLPSGEKCKDVIIPSLNYRSKAFLLGSSGKVYISKNSVDIDNIYTADWAECTDLEGRFGYFGTLSSQAPIVLSHFNLIIPD